MSLPGGKLRLVALGAALLLAVAVAALWLFRPGAAARALALATDPPLSNASGTIGCPLLGLENVRIARQGDAVVLVNIADGRVVPTVWPYGFSARLLSGKAEIVSPDGHVTGREGDSLGPNLGSYWGETQSEVFHICSVSAPGYQWWPSAP